MTFPLPLPDQITIYGAPGCHFCEKAKVFVSQQDHYAYTYFNIEEFGDRKSFVPFLLSHNLIPEGVKTIPIIFVEGKFIGGYTELCKHLIKLDDDF